MLGGVNILEVQIYIKFANLKSIKNRKSWGGGVISQLGGGLYPP